MQQENGDLQRPSSINNGLGDLGDSASHQKAGRDDTDDGCKGKDLFDESREVFVGGHTDGNGSKDNLSYSMNEIC